MSSSAPDCTTIQHHQNIHQHEVNLWAYRWMCPPTYRMLVVIRLFHQIIWNALKLTCDLQYKFFCLSERIKIQLHLWAFVVVPENISMKIILVLFAYDLWVKKMNVWLTGVKILKHGSEPNIFSKTSSSLLLLLLGIVLRILLSTSERTPVRFDLCRIIATFLLTSSPIFSSISDSQA